MFHCGRQETDFSSPFSIADRLLVYLLFDLLLEREFVRAIVFSVSCQNRVWDLPQNDKLVDRFFIVLNELLRKHLWFIAPACGQLKTSTRHFCSTKRLCIETSLDQNCSSNHVMQYRVIVSWLHAVASTVIIHDVAFCLHVAWSLKMEKLVGWEEEFFWPRWRTMSRDKHSLDAPSDSIYLMMFSIRSSLKSFSTSLLFCFPLHC